MNASIRREKKALRAGLSTSIIAEYSSKIASYLMQSEVYYSAQHIAYYLPVRGEADARTIANYSTGKSFYLPVVQTGPQTLFFARVDGSTKYNKNKFGILEPVGMGFFDSSELDLVVAPLVSYDSKGNRLGMGGGFYDRTFSYKKTQINKPLLIGYAYSFQQANTIKVEPWDVLLDGVVTEKGFVIF